MTTTATIYKRASVYVPQPCSETTIIVAPNGKLVTLTFLYHQTTARIVVRDFWTGNEIATAPWPAQGTGGGTAIVADGTVHVFAALGFIHTAGNSIVHAVFDANWVLSTPQVVWTATAPDNVCNLGITASPHGYVMSIETQQANRQLFFLKSTDLTTWSAVGTPWATGEYLGSPKIYWSQRRGCFFVTYLRFIGSKFHTYLAKVPANLNSYTIAPNALVSPDGQGETSNTSDMTIAEYDGVTHLIYMDGEQTAYTNYRASSFMGTMERLWEQFFPFEQVTAPPSPPPSGNVLPQMTGPTTAGVTISASDQYGPLPFYPWQAADRNESTFYHCSNTVAYPHWWRPDLAGPATIISYGVKCRPGFPAQAPKDFSLQALVSGNWVTVDQRSGVTGYQDGLFKDFIVASPVATSAYRLFVTANVEGSANLSFGEIDLRA
jgi:hypothetical protein